MTFKNLIIKKGKRTQRNGGQIKCARQIYGKGDMCDLKHRFNEE